MQESVFAFLCAKYNRVLTVCMCCVSLVECYVSELHKQDQAAGQGVYAVPTGAHVKDNEEVMSVFLF